MKIGLIQMEVAGGEKERNIHHAFDLMEQAAPSCDLLVLPELWTIGYDFRQIRTQATRMGDSLVEGLGAFAKYHHITLAAGTLPIVHRGELYNTALLFGPSGELQAHYSKRHLFSGYLEGTLMTPGRRAMQTVIGGIQSGMAVCYELYFPDLFRAMARGGTTLVMVPASWPLIHVSRWEILARARAIENGIYVCAVNMAGTYHGVQLGGHSLFIDPEGTVQAEAGTAEEILYGTYEEEKYRELGRQLAVIRSVKEEEE